MKKVATVAILLLIIIATFSFVFFRLQANGSENNFFNKNLRLKFDRSVFLRQIVGLHYDGDARFDYLGSKTKKIIIEVDEMEGLDIPQKALNLLVSKMKDATGKEVSYIYSDTFIPFQDQVTDADVATLVKKYKNSNTPSSAHVYLLYLNQYQPESDLLGSTYQENSLVLYGNELKNFTRSSPDTFANYFESTALHEFGHQLGLGHNDESGCLMNAHAEQSHVAQESASDVIVDFCADEKQLINNFKL